MKIGIFGGTFDPVHNVHLFIAESARRLEQLDRVLFVPTQNVHYRDAATAGAEHRVAMLLGALESNDAFSVDDSELRAGATGYTADLLPRIAAKYPQAKLAFIAGADSLASNAWVRIEEVLEALDAFIIAPRSGITSDAVMRVLNAVPPRLRERVRTLQIPELPESATLVRALLTQGKSVRYLVPDSVWRYASAHRLYANPSRA